MIVSDAYSSLAAADWWQSTVNYQILPANPLWRFVLLLIVLLITLATGRIVQFALNAYAARRESKTEPTVLTLFLKSLSKPAYVAFFALALYLSKLCLVFENLQTTPPVEGISATIETAWLQIAKAIAAITVAYAIFRLVDIAEYYLLRWTGKTDTRLDDMLVPVIRKSLRVTIAIIAVIYIVDNVLHQDVKSILLGAGVGGVAIALAAKETIANFFGSITIFADRPFQVAELVKIEGHFGPVEEVGFRSTRVRTLDGHLVTIPNSTIANSIIENVGRRPFIRRTSNITITYDSKYDKTKKAVDIIKQILADTLEVNKDPDHPPRVYFSDYNDCSLNIYMSYWVKPPDYWLYHEVNERVNFEIMKQFTEADIEFAFPTQTLYLKKE